MQLTDTDGALPPAAIRSDHGSGSEGSAAPHLVRLPIGLKVGYGAGQLVELIVSSTLNIFVLFYVTAVCGLPGGLAGLALGAGMVVDAIADPFIGSLSDGWCSRFGRRVPFMIASLVPLVLTFNLIFALPSALGQVGLFLWLLLLSVALRISLSMFMLPYLALGAELSDDYVERSSIAAWRWGIGILGTIAVIWLGYGLFLAGPGGVSHRAGYVQLTLTLSALLLTGAVISIWQGFATRHMQHDADGPTVPIYRRLFGEMREMFRNRTFRVLFIANLLLNIEVGVNQALSLHVLTFFWKLSGTQMQAILLPGVLGLLIGAPLAGPLGRRVEKRTMLIIGMAGLVICHALPPSLKLLGLLPLAGNALIGFLMAVMFINGVVLALTAISLVSIIPDAADEHEHLFGARREGLYFAGSAFANKAATGAGILVAGIMLQLINFPTNLAERGGPTALPERTVEWLGIAGGPGAALLSIAAIAVLLLYRINKESHARIIADLIVRRDYVKSQSSQRNVL